MPILPPSASGIYDTGEYILQLARARCNDAGLSLAGNLLADSQPYTLTYLNSAIRTVQDMLANNGVEAYPAETILEAIPVVGTLDPASQCWIGFQNFFDGVELLPAPVLPADLEIPLRTYERMTGSNAMFIPMLPTNDGLPSRPKTSWLREWEWRDDAIYLVGALQVNDMRLRYQRLIADLTSPTQPIPMLRCSDALAWFVAAEFANPRGSALAPQFYQLGNDAVNRIILRSTRKTQRNNNRRMPYDRQSGYPVIMG